MRVLVQGVPFYVAWLLLIWAAFGFNARGWAASVGLLILAHYAVAFAASYYEQRTQKQSKRDD